MSTGTDAGVTEVLDVRDVEGEPFDEITSALETLDSDDTLRLVNSFEPEPLYTVLESRGFEYDSEQIASDEWHVLVWQS
ncbi:MAG: DUF2249 domain-containing protein [Halobacteriaceae archaeon]